MTPKTQATTNQYNKARAIPTSARQEADYGRSINANIRGLWRGVYSVPDFIDNMALSIDAYFHRAWYEGARECGVSPQELTLGELSRLQSEINNEIYYAIQFSRDIANATRSDDKLLRPHTNRTSMWVNRYQQIKSIAMSMACNDQKLEWIYDPTKEHCPDCLRLNGRVYRASTWRKYDLYPKKKTLAS